MKTQLRTPRLVAFVAFSAWVFSACFVQGEEFPASVVLNVTTAADDAPDERGTAKRALAEGSWQPAESVCLIIRASAKDLKEPVTAENHLPAENAAPDFLDVEMELPPGKARSFTATVFASINGALAGFENAAPLTLDLAEGATVREDLTVDRLETADADFRVTSERSDLAAVVVDAATNCLLGSTPCRKADEEGTFSCFFPALPLNRDLIPGFQVGDDEPLLFTDQRFALGQAGQVTLGPYDIP